MIKTFDSYGVNSRITVEGKFDRSIYSNEQNGYNIYTFDIEKLFDKDRLEYQTEETITVTGFFEPVKAMNCVVTGSIVEYKGYKQLNLEKIEVSQPTTCEGIISFLCSGLIQGIGEKTAERIVNGDKKKKTPGLGEKTLDIIRDNPERLTKYSGITPKKAEKIHESYMKNMEYQYVMAFFQKYGITPNKIIRIYKVFKGASIDIAAKDPFQLTKVTGFGYKTVDEIARKLGLSPHNEKRIQSGIEYTLEVASDDGHCYLTKDQVILNSKSNLDIILNLDDAKRLLSQNAGSVNIEINIDNLVYNLPYNTFKKMFQEIQQKREKNKNIKLAIDSIPDEEITSEIEEMVSKGELISVTKDGVECLYLPELYFAEKSVAESILRIVQFPVKPYTGDIPELITQFEKNKGFQLEDRQRLAPYKAVQSNFMVLTGSAGSGKTTTMEAVIHVLRTAMGDSLKLVQAAPTGKAAKRMTEVTGIEALTIHRLLGYRGDNQFEYNKDNKLPYNLIVIDETSMLSINIAKNLLDAIPSDCKVLFIGDIKQLPCIGAGNVLKDIIKSGIVNVVELNVIKRQADGSGIISNANRILDGQMLSTDKINKDFYYMEVEEKETVAEEMLKVVKSCLGPKFNYSIDDIQLICPQRTSEIGTVELNKKMQELVNPAEAGKQEIKRGNIVFRVMDRVIHLNNNYNSKHYLKGSGQHEYILKGEDFKGVFNGELGKITDVFSQKGEDDEGEGVLKMAVQYDDFIIIYEKDDFDSLDLAYALTTHKLQGSACTVGIIPMHYRNFMLLSNPHAYTSVTRCRKLCVVIGQRKAVHYAVTNNKVTQRNTMLAEILQAGIKKHLS